MGEPAFVSESGDQFVTAGGGLLGFGSDTPGVLSAFYYYNGTGNITYTKPIVLYQNVTGASGGASATRGRGR